jgi:hypothetical protein
MLICHRCGLTNLPYNVACPVCERPLQDEAAAAAKRAEWDALPKGLREEQERVFERMRGSQQHHHQWLKKNRWTQAVLGALLVNFILGASTFFAVPWSIPVDLILGGAAGWALNLVRGGAYRGLLLFTAAASVSTIARFALAGLTGGGFGVGVVLLPFAFLGVMLAGYLIGLKMDHDHGERATTG